METNALSVRTCGKVMFHQHSPFNYLLCVHVVYLCLLLVLVNKDFFWDTIFFIQFYTIF